MLHLQALSIYVTGKVIDAVHTKHRKVTLMIVTNEAEKMKKTTSFNCCTWNNVT